MAALPHLPHELKSLAERASRQPSRHLPDLILFLETEPSWAIHSRVLEICLDQFKASPPTTASTGQLYQDRMEVVVCGLRGICLAFEVSSYALFVRSTVLKSWPALWRWMEFLYHECTTEGDGPSNPKSIPTERIKFVTHTIQSILTALFHPALPTSSTVLTTPGILRMARQMWAGKSNCPPKEDGLITDVGLLGNMLAKILESPLTDVRDLAGGFGNSQAELASMLLKPVQMAIYGGESWIMSYPVIMRVPIMLVTRAPDLFNALPSKEIMADMCYALTYFSSLPHPTDRATSHTPTMFSECINVTIKFINSFMLFSQDYVWIIHALHFKLVPAILRTAIWCTDPKLIGNFSLLLAMLQQSSIHRPVLRCLQNVVDSKAVVSLASRIPRGEDFWSEWYDLCMVVKEMSLMKAAFERSAKYTLRCVSPQCGMMEHSERFKSCSACREAVYCSPKCQKDHWKIHRVECSPGRRGRDSPLTSPRNIAYFSFVLEQRMTNQQLEIVRLRDEALQTERQPLVLFVDYAETNPPSISVHRLTEFDPDMFGPLPKVHPLLSPCLVVRYGTQNIRIPIKLDVSDELFGWFGGNGPR